MAANMVVAQSLPRTGRRLRRPEHVFGLKSRPFSITPFMISPVLPGETLKNLLLQSRVVTDPIKNGVIGWWKEYYFFYVKHRDLVIRDTLETMVLQQGADVSAQYEAASTPYYHYGGTINWSKQCLRRVTEEYFRDRGETWDAAGTVDADGLPLVQLNNRRWMDSFILDAAMPEVNIDTSGTEDQQALEKQITAWEYLRANALTNMTYEDWLRSYGVSPGQAQDPHAPELLRYIREWQYPTNHVEPTTGVPASAVSWGIAERADKDRFFREPGFIFGVTVTRPKTYWKQQPGSAVGMLTDAFSWLPAIMRDDPYTSLKQFAGLAGPLPLQTASYWVDQRDLFLYGDQWVNFPNADDDWNFINRPSANGVMKYPPAVDINVFKTTGVNKVKEDGIVALSILGTQVDHT